MVRIEYPSLYVRYYNDYNEYVLFLQFIDSLPYEKIKNAVIVVKYTSVQSNNPNDALNADIVYIPRDGIKKICQELGVAGTNSYSPEPAGVQLGDVSFNIKITSSNVNLYMRDAAKELYRSWCRNQVSLDNTDPIFLDTHYNVWHAGFITDFESGITKNYESNGCYLDIDISEANLGYPVSGQVLGGSGLQDYALTNTSSATQRVLTTSTTPTGNGQVVFMLEGVGTLDVGNATSVRINKHTKDGQVDYGLPTYGIGTRLFIGKKLMIGDLTEASMYFNVSSTPINATNWYQMNITQHQMEIGSVWTSGMQIIIDKFVPSMLKELTDVNIPAPTTGQVLTYDAGYLGGTWRSLDPSGGGGSSFYSTLNDVSVTGRLAGSTTYFDNTAGKYLPCNKIKYDPALDQSIVSGQLVTIAAHDDVGIVATTGSVTLGAALNSVNVSGLTIDMNTHDLGNMTLGISGNIDGSASAIQFNAVDGDAELNAVGSAIVSGTNGAVVSSTAGYTQLKCGVASNDYCKISVASETAAQYATKIATFDDSIPNLKAVKNAITSLTVRKYADLDDVSLFDITDGCVSTWNATTQKFTTCPFVKVLGGAAVRVLGDTSEFIGTNGVTVSASTDTVLSGGDSVAINSTGGVINLTANTQINLESGTGLLIKSVADDINLNVSTGKIINIDNNVSASDYATVISSTPSAVPNVQFVTDAITNANSPTASTYNYRIDTTTTSPPVAAGHIIYNNSTQTSATILTFSHLDDDARDIEILLGLYPVGTKIVLQDSGNTANFQQWATTALPIVTAGQRIDFLVSLGSSGGTGTTGFANNDKVLSFFIVNVSGGTGTVTSVAALTLGTSGTDLSSSVANSTTTPVITLNVPNASATNRGVLTSADWSSFNAKGTGTVTDVSALTIGTSGTNINSSVLSSTSTPLITLNVPNASATNRGALTSADWSTFNAKGNGTVTSVAALTLGTTGTDVSSTVATGTSTPVITLQLPSSSATNRGLLTAADWSAFTAKQAAITLTTTGTSGAATLVGSTLNIPQYSGGGGGSSAVILANPYPICKINASITPATTQYYMNCNSAFTGTATAMRFMLYATGSDSIRLALYRANDAWGSGVLIGQNTLTSLVGYSADTVYSLTLTAESGQNLNVTAGECLIMAAYINGTTNGFRGSTITSSTVAWYNTTDLTGPAYNFGSSPASKATNAGTIPMLELVGTH